MVEIIFKSILVTSLVGTVLATLIMLIKLLGGRKFSCNWNYYIWLSFVIVMLLPIHISLPDTITSNNVVTLEELLAANQSTALLDDGMIVSHDQITNTKQSVWLNVVGFLKDNISIIANIWLVAAITILTVKIFGYVMFLIKIRKCSETVSCSEINNLTSRKVRVRVSENISSPLVVGLIFPTLLLPKADISPMELKNVLSHEMTHLKRNDILYKWLVTFVKCVHWFNPVCYLIAKQIDTDCEIACDYEVVKQMNAEEERSYIETILILLAHGKRKNIPVTTGMVSDKKTLKRRFNMIKNKHNTSKKMMVISIIIAVFLLSGAVFASGVLQDEVSDETEETVTMHSEQKNEKNTKIIEDENVVIEEEKGTGKVVTVESHPALVPTEPNVKNDKDTIKESASINTEKREDITFIKPCEGEISQEFEIRNHPITGEKIAHQGIDIKADEGTVVASSISGNVKDVGFNSEKGNYIIVEQGNVSTVYTHLKTSNVKIGDTVSAGDKIGEVGNSGMSTGAHLHFEVIVDGEYQNPELLY